MRLFEMIGREKLGIYNISGKLKASSKHIHKPCTREMNLRKLCQSRFRRNMKKIESPHDREIFLSPFARCSPNNEWPDVEIRM